MLLVASPSLAQISSIAICGCLVGRAHLKMVNTRRAISMQAFNTLVISCASIQLVFKVIDNTDFTGMLKMVQMVMHL
jgi:hypothetical protein